MNTTTTTSIAGTESQIKDILKACALFNHYKAICCNESKRASFINESPLAPMDAIEYMTIAGVISKSSKALAEFFGINTAAADDMKISAIQSMLKKAAALESATPKEKQEQDPLSAESIGDLLAAGIKRATKSTSGTAESAKESEAPAEEAEHASKLHGAIKDILMSAFGKSLEIGAAPDISGAFEIDVKSGKVTPMSKEDVSKLFSKECPDCTTH